MYINIQVLHSKKEFLLLYSCTSPLCPIKLYSITMWSPWEDQLLNNIPGSLGRGHCGFRQGTLRGIGWLHPFSSQQCETVRRCILVTDLIVLISLHYWKKVKEKYTSFSSFSTGWILVPATPPLARISWRRRGVYWSSLDMKVCSRQLVVMRLNSSLI